MRGLVLKQTTVLALTLTISVYSLPVLATSERTESNNDEVNYSAECYDSGHDDVQNGPFSQGTYDHSGEGYVDDDYYKGFIDGCMSVEGNTRDVCESATDT